MKIKNLKLLLAAIFLCEGAGIVGSFFTAPSIPTWYASLNKPLFTAPNWAFAPVWTTLFALMGLALYKVAISKATKQQKLDGVKIFLIQLLANVLWSMIFFGQQNIGLALVEIVVLLALILATARRFYKIDKTAGYLLIPYILWVSFASYLNFTLWILNP